MSDRFFKKDKTKFTVGYASKVFKYDRSRHNIEDLENRFDECDADGNPVKTKPKPKAKKKKAEVTDGE